MPAPAPTGPTAAPAATKALTQPPTLSFPYAGLHPAILAEPDTPPTVVIVDDSEINRRLLKAMLKVAPYRILEVSRASEALRLAETEKVDLVILDLMIPEMSGTEFCQRLRANPQTHLTPVLILTSQQGVQNEIAGIRSGANEFLTRPLHPAVVRTRVEAMLRHKAAIDSLEEVETILFALAQAVEQRDRYTAGHCQRLASYGVELGIRLGLSRIELLALHRGGYLHDIGKISIPDAILFKAGALNEDEWAIMRDHTVRGEEICKPMKSLAPVLPIIRNHHERWDGTGYPDALQGEDIPLLARILQIVDVYDALLTARPYKPAFPHSQALEVLSDEARRGWRDPELVALFVDTFPDPPAEPLGPSLENMRRELLK